MSNEEDESLTLTIPEAAKLLRISRGVAYEAARSGELPTIRFGRVIRVPRYALKRLLDGQRGDIEDKSSEA